LSAKAQTLASISEASNLEQASDLGMVDVALYHDPETCFHSEEEEALFIIQQLNYSEERGKDITLFHGPLGHFGVDKTYKSAISGGLDQLN
jgi:hypothetical protein